MLIETLQKCMIERVPHIISFDYNRNLWLMTLEVGSWACQEVGIIAESGGGLQECIHNT